MITEGILKGISPCWWGLKVAPPTQFGVSEPHPRNLVGSWDISLTVKPEIVGITGANMQWGHFVSPSCSHKWESTAFELILQSAWGLSSPSKQVGRISTPCQKRSQVWVREVNGGQSICSGDASIGNGKQQTLSFKG